MDGVSGMKLDARMGEFPLEEIPAYAAELESMGITGGWSVEVNHDPFLPLVGAAQTTSALTLGTNVAIAFSRTPYAAAVAAWDLQRLSGGRFMLGLGTANRAHVEGRFSADFERPVARILDYVRCIRAIWANFQLGTAADYRGEFYRFTEMDPFFNPGTLPNPAIPIYLAGATPMTCRAAGVVADGLHVAPIHSPLYLREVIRPNLDTGAKRQGRSIADLGVAVAVIAATGETQQELDAAAEGARLMIAFYCSLTPYRHMLDFHGYGGLQEELAALAKVGDTKAMRAKISDDLLDHFALVTDAKTLGSALRDRYRGLADRVTLKFTTLEQFRKYVNKSLVEAFHGG